MNWQAVMSFLSSLMLVYAACLFALYLTQRNFIYFPTRFESYNEQALQSQGVLVVEQVGLQWLVMPALQPSDKYLIYFHGNGGAALDRLSKMAPWAMNGYHVVFAEYPGYGTNTGQNGEQEFYAAARVVIDKTKSDFPDAILYLYGESIGSGTAVQMATEYDVKALIIEAGFSSLTDLVRMKMPFVPTFLLKDRFDNIKKINDIDTVLLSIHGTRDGIVPYRYGKKLYDAYNGSKDMMTVEGAGHNDLFLYVDMVEVIQKLE